MATATEREPTLASSGEEKALMELDAALAKDGGEVRLIVPSGKELRLPEPVREVLRRAVGELARGDGVSVLPVETELTTQQAAELLSVSRPYLVKLLEEEQEIPFHKVGRHRRVKLADLLEYKRGQDEKRRSLLGKLSRDAQEAGLYE
jgi:excisionase family DNA binding protein